jgi:type III pantothenate kinase
LIDHGNTRLKWVLARSGQVDSNTAGSGTLSDLVRCFESPAVLGPGTVMVSSVADSGQLQALEDFCGSRWGLSPWRLTSLARQGEVNNAYDDPSRLGVDRWLAIVGAVAHHGKPVVIWDLGTAATLDAVDEHGQHLGGMIYPGPATMLNALRNETLLKAPQRLVQATITPGSSTRECIENGVLAAQVGALNQFMREVAKRMPRKPRLVVTGGAAPELLPLLDFDHVHDPWLVFRGMLVE